MLCFHLLIYLRNIEFQSLLKWVLLRPLSADLHIKCWSEWKTLIKLEYVCSWLLSVRRGNSSGPAGKCTVLGRFHEHSLWTEFSLLGPFQFQWSHQKLQNNFIKLQVNWLKINWLIWQIVCNDKLLNITNCTEMNISDHWLPVICNSVQWSFCDFHVPVSISSFYQKLSGDFFFFSMNSGRFKHLSTFLTTLVQFSSLNMSLTCSELHALPSIAQS